MVSQSGGVATEFGYEARFQGIGLSKIISFGNGCDLDATKLLEYLADDPETGYIAVYLEGVREGRRFLNVLRRVTDKKPVLLWKAGLTPLGGRAALSHTGSLAGASGVWEGALTQSGAVSVQGLDEMMDALVALYYMRNGGRRIALLGGGGAIGVYSSDLAHRMGLEIPTFSRETQKRLNELLPSPGNSVANPLDTGTPALPLETILTLAKEVLTREPVDTLIMIMLMRSLEVEVPIYYGMMGKTPPPRGRYLAGLVDALSELKQKTGKDVVMVFENRALRPEDVDVEAVSREMRLKFQGEKIPVYPSAERALRGLGHAQAHRARS
jgi:acyl-CoA synthetase (NDP forming)